MDSSGVGRRGLPYVARTRRQGNDMT